MVNRSYRIGYNFERRVIKYLESHGYFVIRSGKSRFPDGIAVHKNGCVLIFECKVNKYLSREEKKRAAEIYEKTGIKLTVFWREKKPSYKLHCYEV